MGLKESIILVVVLVTVCSKANGEDTKLCNQPINLLFLVDKSKSITTEHFDMEKQLVEDVIESFHISPEHTRVSLLMFGNYVVNQWDFNKFNTKEDLIKNVRNLDCPTCGRGKTVTGSALKFGRETSLMSENGARDGAKNIVVVMFDGRSTELLDFVKEQVWQMQGIATVVAVGVGDIDQDELTLVASSPDLVFVPNNVDELKEIADEISGQTCEPSIIGSCPIGWTSKGERCYKMHPGRLNYHYAEEACSAVGAHLVMPKTEAEFAAVVAFRDESATPNRPFWIGLSDLETEDTFVWEDGTPFCRLLDYHHFRKGEPNNCCAKDVEAEAEVDCVVMQTDGWLDIPCSHLRQVICQKDAQGKEDDEKPTPVPRPVPAHVPTPAIDPVRPNGGGCKQGWTHSSVNNKCYRFYPKPRTVQEGIHLCLGLDHKVGKSLGNDKGLMAMPKNKAINDFINKMSQKHVIWLGMAKHTNGMVYADFTPVTDYRNWAPGEPNNVHGDERCYEMFATGKWNDIFCDVYRNVITKAHVFTRPVKRAVVCEQNP